MKTAWRVCLVSAWVAAVAMAAGCGGHEPASPGGQADPGGQPVAVEQTSSAAAAKGPLAWVERLKVGEPAGHGSLLVFPVISESPEIGEEYLTLEEGIRLKFVRVTEVGRRETPEQQRMSVAEIEAQLAAQKDAEPDDGGSVNTLLVHNHGDKPLFILSGQTVCGGKQDRICYEDVIVPPHTSNFEIKVFCVEQGRWHLASGDGAFDASEVAVDSVRKTARAEKDQSKVWSGVQRTRTQTATMVGYADVGSGTDAYLEAATDPKLKEKRAPYLDALTGKWKEEKKLAGFVVVIDGLIRSADVFNDPAVFAKLRESLLASYASRAVLAEGETEKKPAEATAEAAAKPVTRADVEAFLKSAYAEREKFSTMGEAGFSVGGNAVYGSAGGDLKKGDKGTQHLYLSVEEKKDKEKEKTNAEEQNK